MRKENRRAAVLLVNDKIPYNTQSLVIGAPHRPSKQFASPNQSAGLSALHLAAFREGRIGNRSRRPSVLLGNRGGLGLRNGGGWTHSIRLARQGRPFCDRLGDHDRCAEASELPRRP